MSYSPGTPIMAVSRPNSYGTTTIHSGKVVSHEGFILALGTAENHFYIDTNGFEIFVGQHDVNWVQEYIGSRETDGRPKHAWEEWPADREVVRVFPDGLVRHSPSEGAVQ